MAAAAEIGRGGTGGLGGLWLLPARLRGLGRCREARRRTLFFKNPMRSARGEAALGRGVDVGLQPGAAVAGAGLQRHAWAAEHLEARGRRAVRPGGRLWSTPVHPPIPGPSRPAAAVGVARQARR